MASSTLSTQQDLTKQILQPIKNLVPTDRQQPCLSVGESLYKDIWQAANTWFEQQYALTQDVRERAYLDAAQDVFAFALMNSHELLKATTFSADSKFQQELSELQQRATTGDISTLISNTYWMSPEVAEQQVRFADQMLCALGEHATKIQVILANMNYSFFKPNASMTNGESVLRQFEDIFTKLGQLTDESDRSSGMPHLVRSNAIMATIVNELVSRGDHNACIKSVIAPGAGYGATPGAALALLLKTCGGFDFPAMPNMLSIEPSPDFFKGLEDTTKVARDMLTRSGANNPGTIENFHGDILSVLKERAAQFASGPTYNPDFQSQGQQPTAFLFNYVLHRMSTAQKAELFALIAEQFEEPLILIGDLAKNGSVINRGYFNYAFNGPLNAGNIELHKTLEQAGYTVMPLAELSTTYPGLTRTISSISQTNGTSDELFLIAFKANSPKLQELMNKAV